MILLLGVLEASIVGGVGILAISILSKKIGNRYRKKYKMTIWFFIALRLLIPIHFGIGIPFTIMEAPVYMEVPAYISEKGEELQKENVADSYTESLMEEVGIDDIFDVPLSAARETEQKMVYIWNAILGVWLTGAILCLAYFVISYLVTSKKLKGYSQPCGEEMNRTAKQIAVAFKMCKVPEIRILHTESVSPFAIGGFKNIIYLPNREFDEKDLMYVLKHEMFHCKNRDIMKKWFFILVNAVHWFNPLVWLMRKFIDQDMELICDEAVLRDATKEERGEYCELIMSYINSSTAGNWSVSTGYTQEVKFIKQRFENIFNGNQKRRGIAVATGMIGILLIASSCIHIQTLTVTDMEYQVFSGTLGQEPVTVIAYREGDALTLYYTNKERTQMGKLSGSFDEKKNSFKLNDMENESVLSGEYYLNRQGKEALRGVLVAEEKQQEFAAEYVRSHENHEGPKASFTQTTYYADKEHEIWVYDPFDVLAFVEVFAEAVQKDDKEVLAGMMDYPFSVNEDEGYRKIKDAQEFLDAYESIVTEEMRTRIEEALQQNLFINYQGVMFGNVWFYSTETGVFAINIHDADTPVEDLMPYTGIEKG